MNEVPEGQLPRDAAFWRTYMAVQAEAAQAWQRIRCERDGHVIVWGADEVPLCDCGMTVEQIYTEYEAQGRGRLEYTDTGIVFRWGLT